MGIFKMIKATMGFVLNVGWLCNSVFVSHTHVCGQRFTSRNGTVSSSSTYLNTLNIQVNQNSTNKTMFEKTNYIHDMI